MKDDFIEIVAAINGQPIKKPNPKKWLCLIDFFIKWSDDHDITAYTRIYKFGNTSEGVEVHFKWNRFKGGWVHVLYSGDKEKTKFFLEALEREKQRIKAGEVDCRIVFAYGQEIIS